MNKREARRITRELTPAERQRLQNYRAQIAEETPDLEMRDQMRKDARDETTLSGELRRAIHASELSLLDISRSVGVTPILLDDFLTGERTLRSDVMDRLVSVLGYQLQKSG